MENEKKPPDSETAALEQHSSPNIPNLTDWSSHDDPGDPHNWSFGKKSYHAGITAAYAFTTYVLCSGVMPIVTFHYIID
jgi:hypothetical protein